SGHTHSVFEASLPAAVEEYAAEETITLVIQINSKIRAREQIPADLSEADVKKTALEHDRIVELLNGRTPKKVLVIQNKLVNIIV
ncbi:MAG: leucine--tRNA ligase, partial [bacterium]